MGYNLHIRVAGKIFAGRGLWGICNTFGLKREVGARDLELGLFKVEDKVGHKCHWIYDWSVSLMF